MPGQKQPDDQNKNLNPANQVSESLVVREKCRAKIRRSENDRIEDKAQDGSYNAEQHIENFLGVRRRRRKLSPQKPGTLPGAAGTVAIDFQRCHVTSREWGPKEVPKTLTTWARV